MTRSEFCESVTTWWELIDFCNDEGLGFCNDVYDDETYCDSVDGEIGDRVRYYNWETIRDWLSDLPCGYDYYRSSDYGWEGLDDNDFRDYYEEVLDYMDRNGFWDDEEFEDEDEDSEPIEETIPLGELFESAVDFFRTAKEMRVDDLHNKADELYELCGIV